ncbi:metallophosphoesterase family protein [Bradyrhizobium tropiciagri]|uniref:metallophosphoesterase family protein n=1 Tax=Bradyrhizobium tropiciagri TaxID=312253 RepID=UPI001BA80E26|nr:metallophosphoesterase family protein [Bradyrhizobium tropiciagri]MBR0900347.1 metallophosphoesterase family protein [Bradyrhizobium tropiciagri]
MKFAAIADIHGNCAALEAVLRDIEALGIRDIVNLGDHLSGPLEARRTADLLMRLSITSIRGNHDRQLVELPLDVMGPSDRHAYRQLEKCHLEWLTGLPASTTFRDEVFLCHGTPDSDTTYWLETVTSDGRICTTPIEEIEHRAAGINASLILCGHTHIPRVVRLRDGRLIINPGSVGCPGYDDAVPVPHKMETGTPDACYAVLERSQQGWGAMFRYVPYDHLSMAELARRNGRAEWASALASGWIL